MSDSSGFRGRGRGGRGRGRGGGGSADMRGDMRGGGGDSRGGGKAAFFRHSKQSTGEGIEEEFRIGCVRALAEFRASDQTSLTFPSTLSSFERRHVHAIANKMGLISKSTGKGETRALTLMKSSKASARIHRAPQMLLDPRTEDTLSSYLSSHHVTMADWGVHEAIKEIEEVDSVRGMGRSEGRGSRIDQEDAVEAWNATQAVRRRNGNYTKVMDGRKALPAWQTETAMLDCLRSKQVTIVSGDTGCGKSTQVPQFILDDASIGPFANIIVTQPRRISAISLAERIAYERCEDVGGRVGYNVRLESASSASTRLLFVTTGVLLRRLTADPSLRDVTHVVLDEVHERDINTDFLLILLRDLLPSRPDLKLIVMSATIQIDLLTAYFQQPAAGLRNSVGLVHITGSAYPVNRFFLEDILDVTGYSKSMPSGFGGPGGKPAVSLFSAITASEALAPISASDTAAAMLSPVKSAHIGAPKASDFACVLCGKKDFSSAEDFGMHAAFCFGELNPMVASVDESPPAAADSGVAVDGGEGTGRPDSPLLAGGIALPGGRRAKRLGDEVVAVADSDERSAMVEAYQLSVNDEEVDMDLLQSVLLHVVHDALAAMASQVAKGAPAGAVLVFLPGWEEISRSLEMMRCHPILGNPARVLPLALHSAIPTVEQRRVFKRPPPGVVKVILSTNIAETSITIDDVVYVIDAGKVKEKTYDAYTGCSSLASVWVSKASSRQRAGRAGRVRAGYAFHLYSSKRHAAMSDFAIPEMLRTPLDELCLQIKLLHANRSHAHEVHARGGSGSGAGPGATKGGSGVAAAGSGSEIEDLLAKAVQPPAPTAVKSAIQVLHDLGALALHLDGGDDVLTSLGFRLAQLPVSPRLGKMILFAVLFRCLDPVLTIACAMSYRPPFVLPMHSGERAAADRGKLELARGVRSDHLALLGAFQGFHAARASGGGHPGNGAEQAFCKRFYLSPAALNMVTAMKTQMVDELVKCGALKHVVTHLHAGPQPTGTRPAALLASASTNGRNMALVLAVIAAGMYPNVARANPLSDSHPSSDAGGGGGDSSGVKAGIQIRGGEKTSLSPGSVASVAIAGANPACKKRPPPVGLGQQSTTAVEWLCYDEMTKVGTFGNVGLRGVSVVPALALLFLCGKQRKFHTVAGGIESDSESDSDSDSEGVEDAPGGKRARVSADPHASGSGNGSGVKPAEIRKGVDSGKHSLFEQQLFHHCAKIAEDTVAVAAFAGDSSTDVSSVAITLDTLLHSISSHASASAGGGGGGGDEDGEGEEPDSTPAVLTVDDWVAFELSARQATMLAVVRNRLALAFHRLVVMPEAAAALHARKGGPSFLPTDEQIVHLAATCISWENGVMEPIHTGGGSAAPVAANSGGGGGSSGYGRAPQAPYAGGGGRGGYGPVAGPSRGGGRGGGATYRPVTAPHVAPTRILAPPPSMSGGTGSSTTGPPATSASVPPPLAYGGRPPIPVSYPIPLVPDSGAGDAYYGGRGGGGGGGRGGGGGGRGEHHPHSRGGSGQGGNGGRGGGGRGRGGRGRGGAQTGAARTAPLPTA